MRNRQSSSNNVLSPVTAGHPNINPYSDYIRPLYHDGNVVLEVECGGNNGLLYLSKLCQGSKGPCILYRDMWLTPNEFQYVSGRETAKDWKRSIRHYGKSMKLLLSKGILAVHPPVCDCTGCRISSPVNRNRLEEKLTPEQVNNGYCGSSITSTSKTVPSMPVFGFNDYLEEFNEINKSNKNNYKNINPQIRKPNGEKSQKLSIEVKKEIRLTNIIDQLVINKTKSLNQCEDKKSNNSTDTVETDVNSIDTPGFSGTTETRTVPVISETPVEHLPIETSEEQIQTGLLLNQPSVNKIKDLSYEEREIQNISEVKQSNQTELLGIENLPEVENSLNENQDEFESEAECSSETEDFIQPRAEIQQTTDQIEQLNNYAISGNTDTVIQSSQLNLDQHCVKSDVSIKTERVSPDLELGNCELSTTYSMAAWTKKQYEMWTRNCTDFIRNFAKYNGLSTLQTPCFMPSFETKLPTVQTMVDRQTHSSPPVYGETQSETGESSNLVRTSSTSQLENYLRTPPKRTHGGEHRSDPLDLTVTTTKKPRIDDSIKMEAEDFLMSFDDSQSCDSKTSEIEIPKSTGTIRCASVCTQQICPDQSETVDVTQWNVDDVVQFVTSIESCTDYAEKFREHCIDGTILPLLTEDHLTLHLGMKLGPALKLRSTLAKLIDHCVICMHCIHCHGENQKTNISENK